MADEIKTTPESELEECKTKIIALTYELTRAYADAKQCRLAVQRLPADAQFQAATAAMQGMLAYPSDGASGSWNNNSTHQQVAEQAVKYADALLAALAAKETT